MWFGEKPIVDTLEVAKETFLDWWTATVNTNLLSPMLEALCGIANGALCPLGSFITAAFEFAKRTIIFVIDVASGETVKIGSKINLIFEGNVIEGTRNDDANTAFSWDISDLPGMDGIRNGAYY